METTTQTMLHLIDFAIAKGLVEPCLLYTSNPT